MKVLWFANTPSLGASYLNVKGIGGGWIESLEAEFSNRPDIDLGVVFKWDQPEKSEFIAGNTIYYPVRENFPTGKIRNLINRWRHKTENEEYIEQYLEVIRQFNPDVIHIFGSESDFGLIISRTSIPCIIHIQGNLMVIKHKWFSGISELKLLKYSGKLMFFKGYGFIHNYFVLKKRAAREKKIFRDCRYYMGRTDWDKRLTIAFSPGSKYFRCDEMLRKQFYSHQWQPDSSQDTVIFSTIRNNIYKGLETIYECKKILMLNYKEYNFIWNVAGINDGDEIAGLVERIYDDKLKDNQINLLGSLQENELIREMTNAGLFVHPSHIDNSPNSVCEAMLLGMPVIATNAGGIPSLINDKIEGLLVEAGNPYVLAGAIIELIRDRNYAVNLGKNAQIRARKRHDPDIIVENVLQVYSAVIADNGKG